MSSCVADSETSKPTVASQTLKRRNEQLRRRSVWTMTFAVLYGGCRAPSRLDVCERDGWFDDEPAADLKVPTTAPGAHSGQLPPVLKKG